MSYETAVQPTQVSDELLKAQERKRRKAAHRRLCEWAEERERIAATGMSVMAKIKQERDGASQSWIDPSELSPMERECERLARVLQVDNWVREMPREWVAVVVGVYCDRQSQLAVATFLRLDRNRILHRLQDAQDRIAAHIDLANRQSMRASTLANEI